jgi:outer membrane protein assembly factor BamB
MNVQHRRSLGRNRAALPLALCAFGICALPALASDWPQWRGPERNGVSKETGLLKEWPQGGPTLLWKVSGIGTGYGTPSVASGLLYGMGYRSGNEVAFALNAMTGAEVWVTRIAQANRRGKGYDEGSRCTPTVDGARVYLLGDSGDLVCLDSKSGKLIWQKDLVADFGGEVPGWGYTESPLIDGEKLIITPGGKSAIVALNKLTGAVVWHSSASGGANYSSAISADLGGVKQYIQFLSNGVVGIAAADGAALWKYAHPANGTANISTPIYRGGKVFAASAYNTGGGLADIQKSGAGYSATEVYFTRQMRNHHGGVVLVGDYLYGFDESNLTCIDFATGAVKWSNRSVGKGSVVYADGHLYAHSENGPVALIEANPVQYVEKGRFEQPDRSRAAAWAHPVVANGKLYIRDMDVLLCYDVKQKAAHAR